MFEQTWFVTGCFVIYFQLLQVTAVHHYNYTASAVIGPRIKIIKGRK